MHAQKITFSKTVSNHTSLSLSLALSLKRVRSSNTERARWKKSKTQKAHSRASLVSYLRMEKHECASAFCLQFLNFFFCCQQCVCVRGCVLANKSFRLLFFHTFEASSFCTFISHRERFLCSGRGFNLATFRVIFLFKYLRPVFVLESLGER